MSSSPNPSPDQAHNDSGWASPVSKLKVTGVPEGATNINVEGRQLTGPIRGFGQMWQKTYRVHLSGSQASPTQVIQAWKEHYPEFWPKNNTMYPSLSGIAPGEIALITTSGPGNLPVISTGIMVVYVDDESFAFMTPEGHPFAGMITFSAFQEDSTTIAQVQVLIRANDPIYEIGFRLGPGHKMEDNIWNHTLKSLAAFFSVDAQVEQNMTLIDPKVQWSQAKNIWLNAGIRTAVHTVTTPFRWVGKKLKK